MNSIDDVEIIDHDLRPKTMIFLGRKTEGDDLETVMEEEALNSKENNNNNLVKDVSEKNNVNKRIDIECYN